MESLSKERGLGGVMPKSGAASVVVGNKADICVVLPRLERRMLGALYPRPVNSNAPDKHARS